MIPTGHWFRRRAILRRMTRFAGVCTRLTREAGRNLAGIAGVLALAGCVSAPPPRPAPPRVIAPPPVAAIPTAPARPGFALVAVRFADLEGWTDADPAKGLEAFRRSCIAILDKAADAPLGGIGYAGRVTDWEEPCHAAMSTQ